MRKCDFDNMLFIIEKLFNDIKLFNEDCCVCMVFVVVFVGVVLNCIPVVDDEDVVDDVKSNLLLLMFMFVVDVAFVDDAVVFAVVDDEAGVVTAVVVDVVVLVEFVFELLFLTTTI